jgi:hypothetical protein
MATADRSGTSVRWQAGTSALAQSHTGEEPVPKDRS